MNAINSSLPNRIPQPGSAPRPADSGAPAASTPSLGDKFVSGLKNFDYKMAAVNTVVGAGCVAIATLGGASVAGQVALAIVPGAIAFGVAEAVRGAKEGAKGGGDNASMGLALGGMFGALKGVGEGLLKAPIVYGATAALASVPAVAAFGLPAAVIGGGVGLAVWGGTQVAKHLLSHH